MSDELLLPAGARLLHIGPQKTGTTSIQVAMAEAREAMELHGAYFPAGDHRRRRAGWALGLPGGPRDTPIRHWEELVAEVRAAGPVRVCVSDENFARAEPAVVDRIVGDLGGGPDADPGGVHVVAVARRLDRYLPSQWQERVKAGISASFEDWLGAVLGDEPNWERWNVWMGHDVEALVARWVDRVGPDRFTLVVADETDHHQLIDVFEAMLGLPAGTLQLHPDRSNAGFGLAEVELLRRLRQDFDRNGWATEEFHALIRIGVRRRIGSRPGRAPGPRHAPLPDWALARIRELSERRADALPGLGVRVLGDPESLRIPPEVSSAAVDLDKLTVPVDLAVDAIDAVIARQHEIAARRAVPLDSAASDFSGRDLLRLAARRALGRLRGR